MLCRKVWDMEKCIFFDAFRGIGCGNGGETMEKWNLGTWDFNLVYTGLLKAT
jgi:hypothetical protein